MGPGDVVATGTLSKVELEVGVGGVDDIVVIDCSFDGFEARYVLVFLPGEDGLVGGDLPVIEEEVAEDPNLHVEREIVPVLEVVFEVLLLISVDDRVDEIEPQLELSRAVQERCDLTLIFTGGSWEICVVLCALAHLDLGILENRRSVLALKVELRSDWGAQPFFESQHSVVLCHTHTGRIPVGLSAGLKSYPLGLLRPA